MPGIMELLWILMEGTRMVVGGIPSSSVPVNVLHHRPITLAYKLDSLSPIHFTSWKHEKNGKQVFLLDTTSKPYHTYPSEFSNRFELSKDLLTLKIEDLRMEDSGMFYTEIVFTDGSTDLCEFNVTVYEPVPDPSIKIKQRDQRNGWCHVTLHCSVPTTSSSLSYRWFFRHRDSDYQPYPDTRDTIHISLRNNFWNSDFLCLVVNPVDKKNVSVLEICNDRDGGEVGSSLSTRVITITIITIIASILVIGALAFVIARKRTKK